MRRRAILVYSLVGILQALAASGAAMLAPFFMKDHGYSIALVGAPLVIIGLGRILSDLLSGALANFVNSGVLLTVALSLAFATSLLGMTFRETMPFFLTVWIVLGFTEAMFGLSIRKIAFDRDRFYSWPGNRGMDRGPVGRG